MQILKCVVARGIKAFAGANNLCGTRDRDREIVLGNLEEGLRCRPGIAERSHKIFRATRVSNIEQFGKWDGSKMEWPPGDERRYAK